MRRAGRSLVRLCCRDHPIRSPAVPLFLIASRFVSTISKRAVAALLVFAASMLVLGAVAFSLTQHISFGLALYWSVTTATTVGYGDIDPHNTAGRVIANLVMITTIPAIGAVFALWTSTAVLKQVRRLFGMDSALPSEAYTVVYGATPAVGRALEELVLAGDPVVLVCDERPADLDDSIMYITGDPADEKVIRASHPERANRALIASTDDAATLVIAVSLHSLAPSLEIYALARTRNVARALSELGVRHTLSIDELVGHTLAKSLETPQAGDLLLQMVDTTAYRLRQSEVSGDMDAKPLSAVRAAAEPGRLVLGVSRGNEVDLGLSDDPILHAGDSLIVLEPNATA
jgi:voltage-gated potassium channel